MGETIEENRRREDLRIALLEERMSALITMVKEEKSHCDNYQRENDRVQDELKSSLMRIENKLDGMNKFVAGMVAVATGFVMLFDSISKFFHK